MNLKTIFYLLLFVNLTFSSAFAETLSPEATVRNVIGLIKEKGDPSPIVDYVSWEENFAALPEKSRKIMNVNTVNELREFYRRILLSPADEIVKMFESKFSDNIAKEKVESAIETVKQRALLKEEEIRKRIKESEYDVGDAKIAGTIAEVPLTYHYGTETKTESVKMIRKNDEWKFAGLGDGLSFGSEVK